MAIEEKQQRAKVANENSPSPSSLSFSPLSSYFFHRVCCEYCCTCFAMRLDDLPLTQQKMSVANNNSVTHTFSRLSFLSRLPPLSSHTLTPTLTKKCLLAGSIPVEGSSKYTIFGEAMRDSATLSLRFVPPL